jgi:hypothetical protein
MASPRTRKIRKLKALRAAQASQAEQTAPVPPAPVPTIPEEPAAIETPVAETAPAAPDLDYSAMTKAELQKILDDRNIVYARYTSKADLIAIAEG